MTLSLPDVEPVLSHATHMRRFRQAQAIVYVLSIPLCYGLIDGPLRPTATVTLGVSVVILWTLLPRLMPDRDYLHIRTVLAANPVGMSSLRQPTLTNSPSGEQVHWTREWFTRNAVVESALPRNIDLTIDATLLVLGGILGTAASSSLEGSNADTLSFSFRPADFLPVLVMCAIAGWVVNNRLKIHRAEKTQIERLRLWAACDPGKCLRFLPTDDLVFEAKLTDEINRAIYYLSSDPAVLRLAMPSPPKPFGFMQAAGTSAATSTTFKVFYFGMGFVLGILLSLL